MNFDPNDPTVSPEAVEQQVKKFRKELSSGTVALLLLSILANAKTPLYGYQIAKLLERSSDEKQGALYPVLRNLSTKGMLENEVVPSENGPPRKYFKISPLGRAVLKEWLEIWQQTDMLVNQTIADNEVEANNGK